MSSRASSVTGTSPANLPSCWGCLLPLSTKGAESRCSCDLCLRCSSSRAYNIPAWSSACRHAGERTVDMHPSLTKPNESFHWNHFGQCGRYQGLLYAQFIFCLLKANRKKDTRVLTTDMVLKCKYSKLSKRGELMSLKEIISVCQ